MASHAGPAMIWYCLGSWACRLTSVARFGAGRCSALAVVSSNSSRRAIVSSCSECGDMQNRSAALLFVEMTAGGGTHCYLLLLPVCAAAATASACRLFCGRSCRRTSESMLVDDHKKQPTTSLASPSRAHRRVLAADRARHQPDAEAALPTPAPLGRKQPLMVRTSAMHTT